MAALKFLDRVVPAAETVEGIVLRYGNFYGPGASETLIEVIRKRQAPIVGDGAGVWSWIHVDDEPAPVSLWLPYFAEVVGARRPRRVPVWLGRPAAGQVPVQWMTQGRGASNEKAKRALGWQPKHPTWRQGFAAA